MEEQVLFLKETLHNRQDDSAASAVAITMDLQQAHAIIDELRASLHGWWMSAALW